MPEAIRFLTHDMVLDIHQRVLDEFGGSAGLRDQGLLESAVAVPAATFGGEFLHDGVPAMAAAYLFHICKNHPFVDGNKRAALASAVQFLYLNTRILKASADEVEKLTVGVADGTVSKYAATSFFKTHVRKAASTKAVSPRKQRKPPRNERGGRDSTETD
jgi:death on curing protein